MGKQAELCLKVLGAGVAQMGSLVAPEYLRFDFTHSAALGQEQLKCVEQLVNKVRAAPPLTAPPPTHCTAHSLHRPLTAPPPTAPLLTAPPPTAPLLTAPLLTERGWQQAVESRLSVSTRLSTLDTAVAAGAAAAFEDKYNEDGEG